MSSWTDKIPQFNPYVQQLPIDEMVKVGMQKQQQYNEGVQRIQSNIDNVAGMDIANDAQKQYLQVKLKSLGNSLKAVAAGDFSNFQLVNSVNGMTNQIAKDETVINAVKSTSKYKQGLLDMKEANKAGKGNASNNWLFKTEANAYLTNPDVTASFNSDYKQYTDYKKNALEIIKGLVKNETTKDVSLEFDKNGNVTGILDATTRTKISGITPERIQSALMSQLSSNDFQQMQIDGRYNYSNSTPEQFINDVNKSYQKDYNSIKEKRDILANSIDSTKSVAIKRKIQDQIESLDKTLNNISTEYKTISESFATGDVESAKAKLHSTKWINNFSQTFSNQEVSQTDETNPYQQVKQFKETKQQDWNKFIYKFNQDERFHKDDNYFKERAAKLAEEKEKREAFGQSGYGGVPFSVDQSTLPEVTLDKIKTDIAADQININKTDSVIMKQFGKQGNQAWLDQQLWAWQNSPGSVDPLLASHFNRTQTTRQDIAANTAMITNISKQADAKYGNISNYIPAGSKPITVNFPSGSYTYTPKELIEFNEKSKRYRSISGPGEAPVSGPGVLYNDAKAKAELSPKEYYLYKAQQEQKFPVQKLLADNLRKYNTIVNVPFQKVIQNKNNFIGQEIKSRIMAMQGVEYGIPLDNEAQKTTFGNALIGFANLADSQGGGLPFSPTLNTQELRAIAGGLQNASIRIVEGTRYAPGMYEVTAADKDGKTQTFRVPPEAYKSVFGNKFETDPAIQAAQPIFNQIIRTGANTTALDGGVTTVSNSWMSNINFPNVQYYGVSGNTVFDELSGKYSIRLNLTDPITKKVVVENLAYPSGGLIDKNKVTPATQGLNDSVIFQMIYNRNPTAKELELIKQGSQNPH